MESKPPENVFWRPSVKELLFRLQKGKARRASTAEEAEKAEGEGDSECTTIKDLMVSPGVTRLQKRGRETQSELRNVKRRLSPNRVMEGLCEVASQQEAGVSYPDANKSGDGVGEAFVGIVHPQRKRRPSVSF